MAKGRMWEPLREWMQAVNILALPPLVALWLLSHWQGLGFTWRPSPDQKPQQPASLWTLQSTAGCIVLDRSPSFDQWPSFSGGPPTRRLSLVSVVGRRHMSERYFNTSFCGFGYLMAARRPAHGDIYDDPTSRAEVFDANKPTRYVAVKLPYWFLVALSASYRFRSWVHRMRERNWSRVGLCSGCGYDLTGNVSGVCPECGRRL